VGRRAPSRTRVGAVAHCYRCACVHGIGVLVQCDSLPQSHHQPPPPTSIRRMAHRSDIVPPPSLAQSAWGLSHPRAAREPHPLNRIRIALTAEGKSEAHIVAAEQEWQAKEKQRLTEHHRALRAARKRARDRVEKRSKAKVNRARHKRLQTPLTPHRASSDREHSSEEDTPSPPRSWARRPRPR
jgi:hypothetical protein